MPASITPPTRNGQGSEGRGATKPGESGTAHVPETLVEKKTEHCSLAISHATVTYSTGEIANFTRGQWPKVGSRFPRLSTTWELSSSSRRIPGDANERRAALQRAASSTCWIVCSTKGS